MVIYVGVKRLTSTHQQRLRDHLHDHQCVFGPPSALSTEQENALNQADIVFGNPTPSLLKKAGRLRWIQLDSAGVNNYLDLNDHPEAPVLISNLGDFYGPAVAETLLAGLLAHVRNLPPLIRAQTRNQWVKDEVQPSIGQLHHARVIILGLGSIGRRLHHLLQAFDCEITTFARSAPNASIHTVAELDEALPQADIVINTLPQTPATDQLLDRRRLARFAPHALFVNGGRGSVIDEPALIDALNHERLGGAVLDVTATEPLPDTSPLWQHPHVILTQHTGGRFPRETDAKIDVFLQNFARFEKGEPLVGLINSSRGY